MTLPPPPLHWIGEVPPHNPPGLFDGLFPSYGALLISGGKEVGKSLIALEICASAVTGEPLWGSIKPTRKIDKVVYFFVEHGGYRSLSQLWSKTGLEDPERRIYVCDTLLPLMGPQGPLQGSKGFYTHAAAGAGLIVFDPLGAFLVGSETENQAAPMRTLINTMEQIATLVGADLLILGHFGKYQYLQETGERVHSGTRGSSAIEHAATAVFYLSKGAKGDTYQTYKLDCEYFKGDPLNKLKLIRPDLRLYHYVEGDPYLNRQRSVAGRKGGLKSVETRRRGLPTMDGSQLEETDTTSRSTESETQKNQ